jgi:nitroreductase
MEFWEVLKKRRSIREFDPKRDVPSEMVEMLLEAAILAPTAGDRQPWRFVVVRDPRVKEDVARCALRQGFIATAPVMIVVCGEPERSGARWGHVMADLHTVQDTAAAAMNILLAATDLGLDSCWVSALREEELRQALKLPEAFRPLIIIPLGYLVRRPGSRPPRRPISEVTTYID